MGNKKGMKKKLYVVNTAIVFFFLVVCQLINGINVTATDFSIGDLVAVQNMGGSGYNVRQTPAGTIIGVRYDGDRGIIIDGPQYAMLGGVTYKWWKISWQYNGLVGWSAEGYPGGVDYLLKVPPQAPTLIAPGSGGPPGTMIYTLTPTMQWTASYGADYYALAISEEPYGPPNVIYNPQQLYGTSHVVPSGYLHYGVKYRWQMQAHGVSGYGPVSNLLYFQIDIIPPTVTTSAATNVQSNSATLNGNLNNMGGAGSCQVWFQWGLTTSYGQSTTPQTKTSTGTFSAGIGSLTPGTTYHFRAVGSNSAGTVYGDDQSFTTPTNIVPPTVTTNAASGVTSTSAILNGNLDSMGGAGSCQVWFQWGLTTSYGQSTTPQTKTSTGTFSAGIGSLNPGTTYHFRAVGSNSAGTVYGGDQTFTTDSTPTQDDLTADSLELIQVIKSPDELIINKNAAACVTIISSFTNEINADIRITYNFGQTYDETGPSGNGVPLRQGWNRVYIPGGPVIHETGGKTDCWISPGNGPWLVWTTTGTDTNIRAFVDYNSEVSETNENNNEIITSKTFIDSKNLRVMVIPVYFPNANPPVGNNEPFSVNIVNQEEALLGMFPVSQNHFIYCAPNLIYRDSGNPDRRDKATFATWLLNNVATKLIPIAKSFNFQRIAIVVHEDWHIIPEMWRGAALGMLQNPVIQEPIAILNNRITETTVAHEIGHTYWLWHPHGDGPAIYGCPRYDVRIRDYETIARTLMSYPECPNIPPGTENTVWIDPNRYEDQIKIHVEGYQYLWIWNLFDQLKQSSKNTPLAQNLILLGGVIYENGTASPVEPWYNLSIGEPNLYPNINGDYYIMLLDKDRSNLSRLGFNISFDFLIEDENGNITTYHKNSTAFVFSIPYVDGTRYIELWDVNNTVVLSKMISHNAPTVEIISPNGGESFVVGEQCTIEWNAEDFDGDPLSFSVSYSTNEVDWIPMTWSLSESQYIWNTSGLVPGTNYKIRVMVCDGINTGLDESDGTFSFSYPEPILIGLINNLNDTDNYLTIYAKWILWLNLKPFSFKIYSSNEMIQLQKPFQGFLFPPVIFGKFNAMVVSESSSSTVHPFRDRLKHLIAPQP